MTHARKKKQAEAEKELSARHVIEADGSQGLTPPEAPAAPSVAALAAEAAALDVSAAPPGSSSSEPAPPPAPEVTTADMLRPLARMLFDAFAPKWGVSDAECDALADSYSAVLDKYFPDGIAGRFGAEFNALILTAAIIGPRLKIAPREAPKADAPPTAAPAPESSVALAPAVP